MMSKNAKRKILMAAVLLSSNMLFNFGYAENITIESVEDYNNFTDNRISGSRDGNVSGNNMKIFLSNDFEIKKQIYGSRGENALLVDNNNIDLNGGHYTQNVYGAYGEPGSTIQNNIVTINNGYFDDIDIYGAKSGSGSKTTYTLQNNKVIIQNGEFVETNIYGAGGTGSSYTNREDIVSNNTIEIFNGNFLNDTVSSINIYGGYNSYSNDKAVSGNKVIIHNAKFYSNKYDSARYDIYGGYSNNSNVENNKIIIDDGEYYNDIYGGYSGKKVEGNEIIINGGTFNGNVYGGDGGNNGIVENNIITIKGGSFNNSIYASDGAELSKNNTVKLQGGDFSKAIISGKLRNNKTENANLVIDGWSGKVKAIERFNNINFENFKWQNGGSVIEIVQGNTESYLKDTNINLNNLTFVGGSNIQEQESMRLIKNSSPYDFIKPDIDIKKVQESADFTAGVAKVGTGETSINENGDLIYTITSVKQNSQTKLVAENRAVAAAFINQGTDLIADSLDTLSRDGKYGVKTFAAVHGNRSKYDVNSDIKINGWSTIVGVGSENEHNGGDFSWGVFYENGSGNYRTYNEFNNEFFRGDGSLVYNGGGVAARYENAHGVYTEGSLRAGMLKSEMTDALSDGNQKYGYKSESEYYGAHIGIGQIIPLSESSDLDVYGKFFHTYTEGDSFNVAGDEFEFDSINSDRLRVGARLTTNKENKFSTYYGLAYEYEFNGDAEMRAAGMEAPTQSLQGSSYMAEIGLNYQPTPDSPWNFDLNMRGYAGEREGATFNVQATYTF